MEYLHRAAQAVVSRACGFGSLGIFCVMVGLSFDPPKAFQAGGLMTIAMTLILMLKSLQTRIQNYKRTELWMCLPKERRPPPAYAQRVTATVMRDTYLKFAQWSAGTSIAMWALALVTSVLGWGPTS